MAGVAATAFYLDAKLHVRKDLNALNRVERAEKNYAEAGNLAFVSSILSAAVVLASLLLPSSLHCRPEITITATTTSAEVS